jgi:hypothetical protein|tara:strand:+ start:167 stop:583 length:417 start_codon:yes stop_codon:yes gene_type:complete
MTEEEEHTRHAEDCLKLLEDHKFVTIEKGQFQIANNFLHVILFTATKYLLDDRNTSWTMINEDIMKALEVPAMHHDNFVFAVNSLIGTILDQQPRILLLGKENPTEREIEVSVSAGEMILSGYSELSKDIFVNMSGYK